MTQSAPDTTKLDADAKTTVECFLALNAILPLETMEGLYRNLAALSGDIFIRCVRNSNEFADAGPTSTRDYRSSTPHGMKPSIRQEAEPQSARAALRSTSTPLRDESDQGQRSK